MAKNRNSFIEQTAKDYDMEYEDVLSIHKKSKSSEFYMELEEFIKARKEKDLGDKLYLELVNRYEAEQEYKDNNPLWEDDED